MPDNPGTTAMTSEDDLNRVLTATEEQLTERLGIKLTEWSPDRVVGTMPVAGNRQPYGLLHGGANAALAETVGS